MDPKKFLTELWGSKPPGKIHVWTIGTGTTPMKRSYWYTDFDRVERELAGLQMHVYFGMSAVPMDMPTGPNHRYKKDDDLSAIPGLWIDLDWNDPAHKNPENLPPTPEDAMSILMNLPFKPTVIVNSGHGYQAHWLFEGGPWVFRDREDQKLAEAAEEWWTRRVQEECHKHGWYCDSTFDLSRVMRIPGFRNYKDRDNPIDVVVVQDNGPRLDRELVMDDAMQYREKIRSGETRKQARRKKNGQKDGDEENRGQYQFVLKKNPAPPPEKLLAMLENQPQFKDTWDRKRKFASGKNSASEYDLSIAVQCLQAEWTWQETVDAMVQWRQKHNEPEKPRMAYYQQTLDLATDFVEQETASRRITETVPIKMEGDGSHTDKEEVRDALCTVWGIGRIRLWKHLGDPPMFYMETDRGEITIGRVGNITSQSKFRNIIAECTGKLIPKAASQREWDERVQALLYIAEEIDLGEASHPKQQTKEHLRVYMSSYAIAPEENSSQAALQGNPFQYKEAPHIVGVDFRKWLKREVGEEVTQYQMAERLHSIGLLNERIHINPPGRRETTRSVWHIPPQIVDELHLDNTITR